MLRKVRAANTGVKIPQGRSLVRGKQRSSNRFEHFEQAGKCVPDEIEESVNVAHHNEAVPQTTALHQLRSKGAGGLFPEAANAADRVRGWMPQRDARFDPTILLLGCL